MPQSTNPISPYGITKLVIEKYAKMHHYLNRLPVICAKPFNAFRKGQKPFTLSWTMGRNLPQKLSSHGEKNIRSGLFIKTMRNLLSISKLRYPNHQNALREVYERYHSLIIRRHRNSYFNNILKKISKMFQQCNDDLRRRKQ